jgi:hypothetical protein
VLRLHSCRRSTPQSVCGRARALLAARCCRDSFVFARAAPCPRAVAPVLFRRFSGCAAPFQVRAAPRPDSRATLPHLQLHSSTLQPRINNLQDDARKRKWPRKYFSPRNTPTPVPAPSPPPKNTNRSPKFHSTYENESSTVVTLCVWRKLGENDGDLSRAFRSPPRRPERSGTAQSRAAPSRSEPPTENAAPRRRSTKTKSSPLS